MSNYICELDSLKRGDVFRYDWNDQGYTLIIMLIKPISIKHQWLCKTIKQNIGLQWDGYQTLFMDIWIRDNGYPKVTKLELSEEELMAMAL